MNIHELIKNQTDLAKFYAEDGAFHSAARVLRELAVKVQVHANCCANAEAMGEPEATLRDGWGEPRIAPEE